MFIIFLKFAENKAAAPEHMAGHNDWLADGFDKGLFVLAGTLEPKSGGCLISPINTAESITDFVMKDPFVKNKVVTPEILEVTPSKVAEQLQFMSAT